ncbi:MAG TPA: AAA family ATPase [Methylovirgula sp.]|nr:AAA family ATPase [Methylovirgula sp.]
MRVYEPPPKNYESLSKDKKDAYHAEAAREWHAQKKMNGLDDAAGPLPKSAAGDIPLPNGMEDYGEVRNVSNDAVDDERPIDLKIARASAFAGEPIPSRPWLVKDMIPDRTVTLLSGDGGVGKSLVAKQLGVAVAAGKDWIGTLPESGPVV